jgi:hypothetical protein
VVRKKKSDHDSALVCLFTVASFFFFGFQHAFVHYSLLFFSFSLSLETCTILLCVCVYFSLSLSLFFFSHLCCCSICACECSFDYLLRKKTASLSFHSHYIYTGTCITCFFLSSTFISLFFCWSFSLYIQYIHITTTTRN